MQFDTSKNGLETLVTNYGAVLLEETFRRSEEVEGGNPSKALTSRDAHKFLWNQPDTGLHVSRASVINFLAEMADEGVLMWVEETCKGGSRRLYSLRMSRREFEAHIIRKICGKLGEVFPASKNLLRVVASITDVNAANPRRE